jgi:aspartyl-tRNA(Asn)/glutamyl-tRNA(Gln) amidotransferase subunit B
MTNLIQGRTGAWEVVIGLETHAHVIAEAKLFSAAATAFGAEPNTQVSLVDAAFPGMLPVINRHCVEQAVKTGLGIEAEINLISVFDRKNYFYADLPAGYQISQYTQPIVGKGRVTIALPDGATRDIGITRLHLEQDAGKSLHDQHPTMTFVDLNRAGVALMEIVSEPDIRSAEEAGAYLRELRLTLIYLGTCDGNMEEGSLRCDCNVSVRRPGGKLGTRTEIKNVNSIRFAMQAIEYEACRQIGILESGGTITQETRLYDSHRGETRPMRSKENDYDYRYFPDPDLLPLLLEADWLAAKKSTQPKHIREKRGELRSAGLSLDEADFLLGEPKSLELFQDLTSVFDERMAANWVIGEVQSQLNRVGDKLRTTANVAFSSTTSSQVLSMFVSNALSMRQAKELFTILVDTKSSDAPKVASEHDLIQIGDADKIEAAIDAALAAHPDNVAQYRAGKDKLFGFFVGQVMKATQGKANPTLVNKLLRKKLVG